ncbi:MAG: class I adenylate-forming enzyme family protein [Alphaproteobacteria bacterium]
MTEPRSVASQRVRAAAASTVGSLFTAQARLYPARIAIEQGERRLTYAALDERVNRTASALRRLGIGRGERIAILSENRGEYLEVQLAAAKLGAIVACQNWRLAAGELQHCLDLVEPRVVIVSPRHAGKLGQVSLKGATAVELGRAWEHSLAAADAGPQAIAAEPEDPLLILYTSGTTGLPKGAVLSHRAEIARMLVLPLDLGMRPGDSNLCWPPLYHMGGTEPAFTALLTGGRVIVEDGFDPEAIAIHLEHERFGWVNLMPGSIGRLIEVLERRNTRPRGLTACGVMPDLVAPHEIARLTEILGASYCNTFGATETGTPPLSAAWLAPGELPSDLAKLPSPATELRLVDEDDRDVADGEPGELAMRGPTLFSGYWRNDEATAHDFRGGWFHMGDLFRRREDDRYEFVDRAKYMIKSGGENIYPAEIERVLLGDPHVSDAVVVRRKDARWGEVPVALVVANGPGLDPAELSRRCRAALAGYKQPKEIRLVTADRILRSTTGKVQRKELESWLEAERRAAGGTPGS